VVGDRGVITIARINVLCESCDNLNIPTHSDWITALPASSISQLARDAGPLQTMSAWRTRPLWA
jgi:hypothetical protein